MKVILLKDINVLGKLGDEITVADGYARNYLIPNKLGVESTASAARVLEQKKRERERRDAQLKAESARLAEKISAVSCTIPVEAGEGDKLFGSVTSEMIAEYLRSEGIDVDKKKIIVDDPIKALGVYNIEIRLHPEVRAQVRVWVVKK